MTRPRRVLVAGISGAGKTTLARKLSARWELPRCELDALHHGPEWVRSSAPSRARSCGNGNRENWRDFLQPYHPIRWAWSQAGPRSRETAERAARFPELTVVRLRTVREVRRWLASARS